MEGITAETITAPSTAPAILMLSDNFGLDIECLLWLVNKKSRTRELISDPALSFSLLYIYDPGGSQWNPKGTPYNFKGIPGLISLYDRSQNMNWINNKCYVRVCIMKYYVDR
jgi:hypothetical protein